MSRIILLSLLCGTALAQWPEDPMVNLTICGRTGEQTLPKIAATSDGGCYVCWQDNGSGNYDTWLQRLDPDGVPAWEGGLLVSGHPQETWITDYDMAVDHEDCAIVAINDIRDGSDRDIFAYRISPEGEFLWGPDGLTLSANGGFEPDPRICVTSDNNVVFAWQEDNVIHLRKVTPSGVDDWDPATITLSATYALSIPRVAAAPEDGVLLQFLNAQGPQFWSPKHLHVQRFDTSGAGAWGDLGVAVQTAGGFGPQMRPDLAGDGQGGAWCYWYDSRNNQLHAYAQHLLSTGDVQWAADGVLLSTTAAELQSQPSLVVDEGAAGGPAVELYYSITNSNQSQYGIAAQRLSAAGEREWGAGGLILHPLAGQDRHGVTAARGDGFSYVAHLFFPQGFVNSVIMAQRVEADGSAGWDPAEVAASAAPSSRDKLLSTTGAGGSLLMAWKDARDDASGDILLQNVNPDGSLGDWEPAPNTVTFQIHMGIQQQLGNFNPDTDQVVVRGAFNNWAGTNPTLTHVGDLLYVGSFDVDDSFIGTEVPYRFVIISASQGDLWESIDNRVFTLEAGGQTLDPVYFNNQDSVGELVNVEVLFRVNMEVMEASGIFVPATDWVVVRGGHANIGNWGGAVVLNEQGGNPLHYLLNVEFDGLETETNLEFKYVILEDQNEATPRWEGGSNRLVPITAGLPDTDQDGYGEIVLEEAWFDHVTWDDLIDQDVTVNFAVNLWPVRVWFEEHPGETNQGLASYEEITFTAVCGPWNSWPWDLVPPAYQLQPTTGDWFEGEVLFTQYSPSSITYKYGANGHDNEAGFQQDYVVTIDDSAPTFNLVNTFGELGDYWDSAAVDGAPSAPAAFALGEAWPNPFNPVTTLSFTNRAAGELRLSVVNLAGQEVAVLSEGRHAAGTHQVAFYATGLASGLYLAVLEGAGETATRKLLLVK